MKVLYVFVALLFLLMGCAKAVPVTLLWTNPVRNAAAPGVCASGPDSCLDLSVVRLWAQRQGRTDSSLVATRAAAGQLGRADSATVDLSEAVWHFWTQASDSSGLVSCKSNVATKDLRVAPNSPTMK